MVPTTAVFRRFPHHSGEEGMDKLRTSGRRQSSVPNNVNVAIIDHKEASRKMMDG